MRNAYTTEGSSERIDAIRDGVTYAHNNALNLARFHQGWADKLALAAAANPFRGSTKRFDPETGSPQRISPQAELSDFGRRYYSATLGRWLNRDPIGDFATANLVRHSESRRRRTFGGLGGANVYAYVGNNPTNRTDYLGLMWAVCLPGEVCQEKPPMGPPDPDTEQEENDKKPCPGKPDLYQQSQPTTRPTPDLSDDWQPPKPYGTCKDCASECNTDDVKQAKAFGVTRTEGGTKCYCICTTRIYGDPPLRGHPGLTLANQIIEDCTVRHEQIHVANGPSENQPDTDSASCIRAYPITSAARKVM